MKDEDVILLLFSQDTVLRQATRHWCSRLWLDWNILECRIEHSSLAVRETQNLCRLLELYGYRQDAYIQIFRG